MDWKFYKSYEQKTYNDSQLVIPQVVDEYKCSSFSLALYFAAAIQMLDDFLLDDFESMDLYHVQRGDNWKADTMDRVTSGLRMSDELTHKSILIQKRNHPYIEERGMPMDVFKIDIEVVGNWRNSIRQYLQNSKSNTPLRIKMQALRYLLVEGTLYRKGMDGLLLKCLGPLEALKVLK